MEASKVVSLSKSFRNTYGYKWDKEQDVDYRKLMQTFNENNTTPLYYYTSVDTFKKFAEDGCIWASHIKRMNDWQEFNLGKELVLKVLDRFCDDKQRDHITSETLDFIKEAATFGHEIETPECTIRPFQSGFDYYDYWYPEIFSISLTSSEDLLSQWKMYARESGISIGFDFQYSSSFWQGLNKGKAELGNEFGFAQSDVFPRQVAYAQDDLEKLLMKIVENISNNHEFRVYLMMSLLQQITFIKHPGFSQENEFRLAFRPYKTIVDKDNIRRSFVGYRESNHVLIPYLKIYCGNILKREGGEYYQPAWPVVSLTVGPGYNQNVVFESLIHFVESGNCQFYKFDSKQIDDGWCRYLESFSNWIRAHDLKDEGTLAEEIHRFSISKRDAKDKFALQKLLVTNPFNSFYRDYCKDNYFSNNGLHIKKSKIPYIFS